MLSCTPFKAFGERLLAFMLLAAPLAGAVGCALPIRPGCSPDDSLPGADPFLHVATIAADLFNTAVPCRSCP